MNKTVKNYYILKSKWLPQDVVATFKPFVINLIKSESIVTTTLEELSKSFKHKYGYRIELFILRPILNNLKQESLAKLTREKWTFDIENMPQQDLDFAANQFEEQYNALINGFITFCDDTNEINEDSADKILSAFIEDNNFDSKVYTGGGAFYDEKDTYRYFLSEYIKSLKESRNPLFDFLVSLCESFLIKSYMFNEGLTSSAFLNKTLYVDTPIIFRLLGYYGEYYKQEYTFLIKSLIDKNCKVFIFERNYNEVMKVLRTAERYVESVNYDIAKSSDVCNYFRSQSMRSDDVGEEIELLRSHLEDIGITICNEDTDFENYKYVEDYNGIREKIVSEYLSFTSNYRRGLPESAIDIDVESTLNIYSLRKNNNIRILEDASSFYISSNYGFVNAIRKYNNEQYPSTISPVISDSFIGMIISGENPNKALQVATNKILSFCYSAFKPTQAMREKFISLLEDEKNAERITERDYIAVRNHAMVNEFLIKSTQNNLEELSQNTVYEVLDMVKAEHIFDAQDSFDRKMQEQQSKHDTEISELKAASEIAMASLAKEKDDKILELEKQNYNLRINEAKEQYNSYKKKIKIKYALIMSLIVAMLFAGTVTQIVLLIFDAISKYTIISAVITGLMTFISIALEVKSLREDLQKSFVNRRLIKKKHEISKNKGVNENDF